MTNDTKVTKLYKKDDSNTDESQQTPNVEQPVQQESTDQEKMESYAKLGKEHGYTGIPNDDAMSDIPMSALEIMDELGIKSRETFRNTYLNPAIENGLVKLTIPDKPTSKNQKYYKE